MAVISNPVAAVETLKRFFRLKPFSIHIINRSNRNARRPFQCGATAKVRLSSPYLSSTSVVTSAPTRDRASPSRRAAIAAPPPRSVVFTINTFIAFPFLLFYAPKSPFNVRLTRRQAFAQNDWVRA